MKNPFKKQPAPASLPMRAFDVEYDVYALTLSSMPIETIAWLKWRGYRGAVCSAPGGVGLVFGRKNEPIFLAVVGDVLEWDGTNVTIME